MATGGGSPGNVATCGGGSWGGGCGDESPGNVATCGDCMVADRTAYRFTRVAVNLVRVFIRIGTANEGTLDRFPLYP